MGLFGKSKKEREKEYMSRIDVPSCLKDFYDYRCRHSGYREC